jgi:hypothetical protein
MDIQNYNHTNLYNTPGINVLDYNNEAFIGYNMFLGWGFWDNYFSDENALYRILVPKS